MPRPSCCSAGILLTGFGSSYYHWNPNDDTLFWDRLPITLAFMAILAYAIEERVDAKAGAVLLWPLLAVGVLSLLVWRWTDDLRLYGWVQFFPCLALPLLFLLFPPKYTGTFYWIIAAALYAFAKLLEYHDRTIYSAGLDPERPHAQASRGGRRLLRDPALLPDPLGRSLDRGRHSPSNSARSRRMRSTRYVGHRPDARRLLHVAAGQ